MSVEEQVRELLECARSSPGWGRGGTVDNYTLLLQWSRAPVIDYDNECHDCVILQHIGYNNFLNGLVELKDIPKRGAAPIWAALMDVCKSNGRYLVVQSIVSIELYSHLQAEYKMVPKPYDRECCELWAKC